MQQAMLNSTMDHQWPVGYSPLVANCVEEAGNILQALDGYLTVSASTDFSDEPGAVLERDEFSESNERNGLTALAAAPAQFEFVLAAEEPDEFTAAADVAPAAFRPVEPRMMNLAPNLSANNEPHEPAAGERSVVVALPESHTAPLRLSEPAPRRVTKKLDSYKRLAEFNLGRNGHEVVVEGMFQSPSKRGLRNVPPPPEPRQQVGESRITGKLDLHLLPQLRPRPEEEQESAAQPANGFAVETVRVVPRLPLRHTSAPAARRSGELERTRTREVNRGHADELPVRFPAPSLPERVREVLLDPTRIDPHLIALSDFNPRAARYYDQMAVSLIALSYKRLLKRVLIASAQAGEGRTCVTLNLAGALARARQRVLVIDCDLMNPSVLRLLGADAPSGLAEAVHRGYSAHAAAVRLQPAGFNILPTREKIQHTAEVLAAPQFHDLLQLCDADYDFILFDSSPLLESTDANLLAALTDGTMLVIRPGATTAQQMARAVALFEEKDICGVVLNRVAD